MGSMSASHDPRAAGGPARIPTSDRPGTPGRYRLATDTTTARSRMRSHEFRRDRNGPGHTGTRTWSDPGRTPHDTEFVNLADHGPPHLDGLLPPSAGQYAHDHT